jgi:hypothetical protein
MEDRDFNQQDCNADNKIQPVTMSDKRRFAPNGET